MIAGASMLQHPVNKLYPVSALSAARVTIGEAKLVLPILKPPISR
jgi:hypothetical protein